MMSNERRAVCVIGWPVEHSRSPLIHNFWIGQHALAGEYRREAVTPGAFPTFVKELSKRGYVGANVTIPHKEAAIALSKPDDRVEAVGAANTLWFEGDTLCSTNTDVEGFLANLDQVTPNWDQGLDDAIVLGAGGASRAIVYGLLSRGVKTIRLANRTFARAQTMRERFGERIRPVTWDEVGGLLAGAGLLVNTTSLGMKGQPALNLRLEDLHKSAVVADIVYSPLVTPLLQEARDLGLRRADGLGMLLHQAVRGFSLWFGVTPEVTPELRAMVEEDLTKPRPE
jgi:shikimate dehydrogenase